MLRKYYKMYKPKHPEGYIFLNRAGRPLTVERTRIFFRRYRRKAKIDEKFVSAIESLLNGSPIRVYFGINALKYQTEYQKRGIATFNINNIKIYELARNAIKKNEEKLKEITMYEGKTREDKMYGYIKECSEQIENNSGNKIL